MVDASDAVWLSVLPDMKSFGPALVKGAGKEADKQGQSVGKRFGKAINIGVAAIATGAVAAGTALYKIGETFDEVTDILRAGTGASGKDLEDFVEIAKNIGRRVPADFETIANAVGDVNTRLGLTGDQLDTFAAQAVEAGRLTGEALDMNAVGAAFNVFKVDADGASDALDHLFRVQQATGVSMNTLASTASSSAPAMTALGFSFEETVSMAGNLDKAGLNASKMMAGMSRALVELAKDGEEPQEAFRRVTGEIQGYLDKGDQAAAIDLASQLFGTRNATQFIGALESGAFALDDLATVAGISEDSIMGVGEETMDFAEHWQMFKNEIMVELAPAAEWLFAKISEGMAWIKDNAIPIVKDLAHWLGENSSWLVPLAATIGGIIAAVKIWTAVQGVLNMVMAANPIGLVVVAIVGLVAAFVAAYKKSETFRRIVDAAWNGIKKAAEVVWNFLKTYVFEPIIAYYKMMWDAAIAAKDWIVDAWNWIKDAAQSVWDFLKSYVFDPIVWYYTTLWNAAVTAKDYIVGAWDAIKDGLGAVWDWIKKNVFDRFTAGIKFVKDQFVAHVERVIKVWDGIKNAFKVVWDWVKSNVFDRFRNGIGVLRDGIKTQVDNVKRIWEGIKKPFQTVWNWIKDNVLDKFKGGLDTLKDNVDNIIGGIDTAWRKLANIFRKPINWVLDKVWNNGIAKAFNNAAKALNVKTRITTEARIPAFAKGGRYKGGLALVGEEGPELINFSQGGHVHTAAETARIMSGTTSVAGDAGTPMGGWWDGVKNIAGSIKDGIVDAVSGAVRWVRGGLADAAAFILKPVRELIGNTVGKWGTVGSFVGDVGKSAMDSVVSWIRGKDDTPPTIGGPGWRRPSAGPVTSGFGYRTHPVTGEKRLHAGIDIAGGGPVFAAMDGTVTSVNHNRTAGHFINMSHGGGIFTRYLHNPSRASIPVSPGQKVKAGERIGRQGASGRVTGTHLHFELHKGGLGNPINPRQLGVFDEGGMLQPGMLAYHSAQMSKPDAVLTARQWDDIHRLAGAGGGGDVYNVTVEADVSKIRNLNDFEQFLDAARRKARQKAGAQ